MDFRGLFQRLWLPIGAVIWLGCVGFGLWTVWDYDNRAGVSASAPRRWPAGSMLAHAADRPTLIFVAHPQCTCTIASLDELAEVLARTPTPPKTYVLFLRPSSVDAGWDQTDLLRRATRLPHAIVLRDDDGAEARRFGVETSGQTLLYDSRGELIFSGGITGSRGHRGDNAGEAALIALLTRGEADRNRASVYGCPLFSPPTDASAGKN